MAAADDDVPVLWNDRVEGVDHLAGIEHAGRDVELAEDLVRQDREINRLNRQIFRTAIEIGDDVDTREWAMHMILVARALERIGDNAVDIGEQVAFVVIGLFREFSDSSHPTGVPADAAPDGRRESF